MAATHTFYEFFAGAGMARAGLGAKWRCVFANEFDVKKSVIYRKNWETPDVLKVADVGALVTSDVPGIADLAWASFPCQDLSLAGAGAGLKGDRSGTFWPFWRLMQGLIEEERGPKLIVLENVCGTLTSHGGKDFAAICSTFVKAGYYFGAVIVDAVRFVPQSRPRLFVIGIRDDLAPMVPSITAEGASALWHPRGLLNAYEKLSKSVKDRWLWWNPSAPARRSGTFADLIEDNPVGVEWHTASETAKLLKMMSDTNREKVNQAKASGRRIVGAVYKRTRVDEVGRKVQRAEIRFDDIAGCLRTPAGGSSRQVIVIVDGKTVRSRLISPRETARLMGLPDDYELPASYNEAYHLTGDGVAVPVVRHLAQHIFEPLLAARISRSRVAA
ncbi:MAG: DNA cytosine methyltransferase [Nitrospira sp.]|nr:DNA cytosine methyltransferase [Nitrospira sp.]